MSAEFTTLPETIPTKTTRCTYDGEEFIYPEWIQAIKDGITSEEFKRRFPNVFDNYNPNNLPDSHIEYSWHKGSFLFSSIGGPYTFYISILEKPSGELFIRNSDTDILGNPKSNLINQDEITKFVNGTRGLIGKGFLVYGDCLESISADERNALVCVADLGLPQGVQTTEITHGLPGKVTNIVNPA